MFTTALKVLRKIKTVHFCISIMHHSAFIVSKVRVSHVALSHKGQSASESGPMSSFKANPHIQHSCKHKKRMDILEQENIELCEEVITLQGEMEKLSAMVASLVAAQNQPPPSPPPFSTQAHSTVYATPISTVLVSTPQHTMHESRPWDMPFSFSEVFRSYVTEAPVSITQYAVPISQLGTIFPQATMTFSAPLVHTIPQDNGPIYHTKSVGAYNRMDDLQERFDEMQWEVKALRMKELFGKNAHDLCLVPNVKIPHKFKVPDFEK